MPLVMVCLGAALAQDGDNEPLLSGELRFEVQADHVVDADSVAAERNIYFSTTELAADLRLTPHILLHADLVVEPIDDAGGDLFFEDHGVFFETLHVAVDLDALTLWAGKANPAFGTAYDPGVSEGVYAVDFAEDYEVVERIGIGGAYAYDAGALGAQTLSAAVFFADTTELSRSYGAERGRAGLEDGGASNTEDLSSFAIALDGANIPAAPGLSYHLAVRLQGAGRGDAGDDFGVVAGLVQGLDAGSHRLNLQAEAAYFENFDGGPQDAAYISAGAIAFQREWFANAGVAARDFSGGPSGSDFTDYQVRAGVGRNLVGPTLLEAGYRFLRQEKQDSHTVGVWFVYSAPFAFNAWP
ncbi:MAG: hypothetical protein AAGC95_07385 [Pseudomonadota bacterium]